MIKRSLDPPSKSFFLFAPRGCGKSTWLRAAFSHAKLNISLLETDRFLQFTQNPSLLRQLTAHLKSGDWVVIDEVQKLPQLLDEVHLIYEERNLNFAISGSSARKLRRTGANMLAGRAITTELFPFTYLESREIWTVNDAIEWGSLPPVVTSREHREDTLDAYVSTYLKEEILAEAQVRALEPFVRFLKVCGQFHGQLLNVEALARESSLKRATIDRYFEILHDTLLARRLPPLRLGLKTKESAHDKFYLFDAGVARACAGFSRIEVDSIWKGYSFESLVYLELCAYNSYFKKNRQIFHYTINQSYDLDFVVELRPKTLSNHAHYLAIEVKSGKIFRRDWIDGLKDFKRQLKNHLHAAIVVYQGTDILEVDGVQILPFESFCEHLVAGKWF